MPDPTPPASSVPTAILTPAQKRWLALLLAGVLGTLVGRLLPGTPIPLPEGLVESVKETQAAVTRIEAGQTAVARAVGLPAK